MSESGLIAALIAAQRETAARVERMEMQIIHLQGEAIHLAQQMALTTAALAALAERRL